MNDSSSRMKRYVFITLLLIFTCSGMLKIINIRAGGPFVTIDDNSAYQGGFLVWFGHTPPQRMLLESWIIGGVCISTFIGKTLISGGGIDGLGINLIAESYRDFYTAPDLYVHVYRLVVLMIDLMTALLVYVLAKIVLRHKWEGFAAVLVCTMYLFSYNTVWCNLVARPDSLMALFSIIGLIFYVKSHFGIKKSLFWFSAISLGLSTGLKLHGAFFVIFIVLDLFRIHGLNKGIRKVIPFIFISIFFFAFAAGSPFFDPLLYVKLRMLNHIDDMSPWIHWGDQFLQIFKGTGWLTIPLCICSFVQVFKKTAIQHDPVIRSLLFQSICWLLLFASIRQLRAYWMLPVLPLFYISAVYCLSSFPKKRIAWFISICLIALMFGQMFFQTRMFSKNDVNQLRTWVKANIAKAEPFYILGYDAVALPKNTECINKAADGYKQIFLKDLSSGLSYTERHIKNWEERTSIILFSMLDFHSNDGFNYYSYYKQPIDLFEPLISRDEMQYIFLQEHFSIQKVPEWEKFLRNHYEFVAEVTGPGGGGRGLNYKIYKKL